MINKQCDRCGKANPADIHTCSPQRKWQGLTDEERIDCEIKAQQNYFDFARAIETKLKAKNNAV